METFDEKLSRAKGVFDEVAGDAPTEGEVGDHVDTITCYVWPIGDPDHDRGHDALQAYGKGALPCRTWC